MTVSRVLRGHDDLVHAETRERVIAAMKELDYVPVRNSSQNRHIETHAIGLVPYYVYGKHDLDVITYQGVVPAAYRHGYDLLVMLRDEAAWMANRREVRFLDRRSDGFIFVSPGAGEWRDTLSKLVDNAIATVVCYSRDVPDGIAWVDPDNDAIVQLAVDRLLAQGHRNIGYLTGPTTVTSDHARLVLSGGDRTYDDIARTKAFAQIAERLASDGIVASIFRCTDPGWRLKPDVVRDLQGSGVTGVLCVNDLIALGLMQIARQAGVSVPRDLSIIGVDNASQSEVLGLTTVQFGYDEVGRLAVEAWIQLRNGLPAKDACRVVPAMLIERTTVQEPLKS